MKRCDPCGSAWAEEHIVGQSPGKGRKSEDSRGHELPRAKDADTHYNIYHCEGNPALGKAMLEKQRQDGVDGRSLAVDPLFVDPLFVDPENGDFQFKPDSPALKLGIVPFDMSKVGLIKKMERSDLQCDTFRSMHRNIRDRRASGLSIESLSTIEC